MFVIKGDGELITAFIFLEINLVLSVLFLLR